MALVAVSYASKVDGLLLRLFRSLNIGEMQVFVKLNLDLAVSYANTARFLTLLALFITIVNYSLGVLFLMWLLTPL
jgi:hypothetical protein